MLDSEVLGDLGTNDPPHQYWSLLWLPYSSLPKPVICLLGCHTYLPVEYLALIFHPASGRPLWPIVVSPSVEHLSIIAALWTLSQCCATCHTVSLPVTC